MKLPSCRFIATLALCIVALEGIIWLTRSQPQTPNVFIVPDGQTCAVVLKLGSTGVSACVISNFMGRDARATTLQRQPNPTLILFPTSHEQNGASELSATRLDTAESDGTLAPFRILPSLPSDHVLENRSLVVDIGSNANP